jgi:hypothetical protein
LLLALRAYRADIALFLLLRCEPSGRAVLPSRGLCGLHSVGITTVPHPLISQPVGSSTSANASSTGPWFPVSLQIAGASSVRSPSDLRRRIGGCRPGAVNENGEDAVQLAVRGAIDCPSQCASFIAILRLLVDSGIARHAIASSSGAPTPSPLVLAAAAGHLCAVRVLTLCDADYVFDAVMALKMPETDVEMREQQRDPVGYVRRSLDRGDGAAAAVPLETLLALLGLTSPATLYSRDHPHHGSSAQLGDDGRGGVFTRYAHRTRVRRACPVSHSSPLEAAAAGLAASSSERVSARSSHFCVDRAAVVPLLLRLQLLEDAAGALTGFMLADDEAAEDTADAAAAADA